jgi:flavin-dependent dehydrogenase
MFESYKTTAVTEDVRGWQLRVSRDGIGFTLATQFVVEATGRASRSMFLPEVRRRYFDRLLCLCTHTRVCDSETAGAAALVESTPDGWWYTACPLGDRRYVAYFTDADFVGPARTLAPHFLSSFAETSHVRHLLPEAPALEVRGFDARTSIRTHLWRRSWLTLGDAAWSLDPLSGTGIERALASALDAADAISAALRTDRSETLRRFALTNASDFQHALLQAALRMQAPPYTDQTLMHAVAARDLAD